VDILDPTANNTGKNRLGDETSPYLLQHQDNPVHWYPWGDEALTAARESNKPILLSIGYSACHWCHVMAHESFADPVTAALMRLAAHHVPEPRDTCAVLWRHLLP